MISRNALKLADNRGEAMAMQRFQPLIIASKLAYGQDAASITAISSAELC